MIICMSEKLIWEEIKARYDQQWVELVDYDWPEEETYPRSGVVKAHASERRQFYSMAGKDLPVDSAIVFVGKVKLPEGVIFSPGMRKVVEKHA